MFNGILKSDDVEVYETIAAIDATITLTESCKTNIIIRGSSGNTFVSLPQSSYVGKILNITALFGQTPSGKGVNAGTNIYIQHSNTNLFTLKQGTVSFMYVGQQLNGLTATDKAKSGWVILGGVQGDTAITGYSGSVAIGSGAYCGQSETTAVGVLAVANGSASTAVGKGTSAAGPWSIAIGNSATAQNTGAVAIGTSCVAVQQFSVAIGYQSYSASQRIAFKANNAFATSGDAQAGKFILMRKTTDATPIVLTAGNSAPTTTNILILPNDGTYAFKGIVVARDASTGDSAMWEVTALMKRGANASTTAIVGTPTITKVFADTGASAWSITLTVDTTNGGGTITVTGEAGKTIRWVSNIDSAEVI